MKKKPNIQTRLVASSILFTLGFLLNQKFFIIAYLISGYDVLWKAIKGMKKIDFMDEIFLMSIASLGAFALGQMAEGTAVMLFYQLGEYLEHRAMHRSNQSIDALRKMVSDKATVYRNGKVLSVAPATVLIGELLEIKPGERVPIDCLVEEGKSSVDTSSLTGEAMPMQAIPGTELLSGMINNDGLIKAKTVKSFSQSTSSRILQLVEQARKQKSKSETFISSFAKVYTPIVVFSAIALTAIPVLLLGKPLDTWIYRSLVFLVVSCPCALVISVPLTFFAGIGALAKKGILVKGSSFMDKLAKVTYVAFDKTGTITKGSFSLIGIYTAKNTSREDLLWLTALSESKSNHPIARSIIGEWEANQQTIRKDRHYSLTTDLEAQRHLSGTKEFAGMGLEAKIDGRLIQVGNEKFMKQLQVALPYDEIAPMASVATLIHVAAEGTYLGTVGIGDILRKDTDQVIQALKRLGIRRTYLLSGDSQANTDKVAAEVGINEAKAQLLPQGKVAEVVKIKQQGGTVAFIGDGMNDAPVIATADVGIAMGALGSDAAIEASDMVVMGEDLATLPQAIRISRKTVRIARQNIVFALTVKIAILILGAFGLATMWMAVFADVGVSMLAILNAMRMLRNRQ